MAIVLTPEQASNLRYRGLRHAKLCPIRITGGNYAVSDAAAADPLFAPWRAVLDAGSVVADGSLAAATGDSLIYLTIDSKTALLYSAEEPHAFGIPGSGVYRFENRRNEFGWINDPRGQVRHNELVARDVKFGSGETLWSSFSFVVGPDHIPFDTTYVDPWHNLIHQWHSVDDFEPVGRPPVFAIDMHAGNLEVITRSDDDTTGVYNGKQVQYSAPRPTDGVVHNVVVSGLLGAAGHLDVWLDGSQIVDVDTAIGYYNDVGVDLAYPHFGVYQKNFDDPTIVYHANLEWGTSSLLARVAAPLSVTAPSGGWV